MVCVAKRRLVPHLGRQFINFLLDAPAFVCIYQDPEEAADSASATELSLLGDSGTRS